VLIIITNYIKHLDPALICSGCVNIKVKFPLTNKNIIINVTSGNKLENKFIAKILKLEFSLAKIMSLLLANKQSPYHVIISVDTWIERIRKERKKLTRTNS
ncbi:hypothetical protein K469DRAFT_590741, partial [Zopfia rhizophila CBS 207.26]